MTQTFALKINGHIRRGRVEADTPLIWVLRDTLDLLGTKIGCGVGICGACTVHIEGAAVRSCSVAIGDLAPMTKVTTIEGLGSDDQHPVKRAWIEMQVPQCGYCQPGMIMAVTALLQQIPNPSDEQIDNAITNICRCGTYARIRLAIHRAAS